MWQDVVASSFQDEVAAGRQDLAEKKLRRDHIDANAAQKRLTEASNKSKPLPDYQMELMLLEQQNKRRLLMARDEQDEVRRRKSDGHTEPLLQTSGEFYEALDQSTEKI